MLQAALAGAVLTVVDERLKGALSEQLDQATMHRTIQRSYSELLDVGSAGERVHLRRGEISLLLRRVIWLGPRRDHGPGDHSCGVRGKRRLGLRGSEKSEGLLEGAEDAGRVEHSLGGEGPRFADGAG